MGGVGGKLALSREGKLQARQHGIEGAGQPTDLVVGTTQSDPSTEICRADLLRHARDPVNRGEQAVGQEPAAATGQEHDRGDHEQQHPPQGAQRVLDIF
jgi:hypothetical protein